MKTHTPSLHYGASNGLAAATAAALLTAPFAALLWFIPLSQIVA